MPYSPNVAVIPLNDAGAVKLKLHPCRHCKKGWGCSGLTPLGKAVNKSCHDECKDLKVFTKLKTDQMLNELSRNTK